MHLQVEYSPLFRCRGIYFQCEHICKMLRVGVGQKQLVSVENMQICCMSDEHLEGEAGGSGEFRLREYSGSTKISK
jgi:hypothetical protein